MLHSLFRILLFGAVLTFNLLLPNSASGAIGAQVSYDSGNDVVGAYVSMPNGQGPYPAIIVIHEWWGLNQWIRDSADRLAEQGYVVLAVDLYRGEMADNPEDANRLSRSLPGQQATNDLKAAFNYLKSRQDVRSDKIAAVGWSTGGGYALTMALTTPDLAACVINYGRVVTEPASIEKIACPVLGIFGANDRTLPSRSILAFEKSCKEAGKTVEIHVIENAGQAFMNNTQPRYFAAEASEVAWEHITVFLDGLLQ
ncbi:MAG: dienelactone hydrolase family protein [Candidatus Latescibacteria bacterium]|jgi:carboxymethylenebutenolidase|nr:dienelactone hydrolase family protein [Candidatus Latescibacterota bacterium]